MTTPIQSLWISAIATNPSLLNSFQEDLKRRAALSTKEGIKWIAEGNIAKANSVLGQAKAYESLLNTVMNTIHEQESQDVYLQKSGGGNGTSGRTRPKTNRSGG